MLDDIAKITLQPLPVDDAQEVQLKMQRRMASLKAMALAKIVRPPRRVIIESIEEDDSNSGGQQYGINEERDVEPVMHERKINITANVPRPQVQKMTSGLEISMESSLNSKKGGASSLFKNLNKPPTIPNRPNEGIKFIEQRVNGEGI